MGTGNGTHEKDDRHHHQAGRNYGRGETYLIAGLCVEHSAAGGYEYQEEGPEQLSEKPAPLQLWVIELVEIRVGNR